MEYLEQLEETFERLTEKFKEELSTIRTNRPTPKLIEDINADYLEQLIPIKQLGSIAVELPRNLLVTPWNRDSIQSISKGIEDARLGVTVSVQGNIVRVTLPELTDERREELSRIVKKITEDTRIKMRVMRDDVNKKINAESDKNTKFNNKEKLQKSVDSFNDKIEELVNAKLRELAG